MMQNGNGKAGIYWKFRFGWECEIYGGLARIPRDHWQTHFPEAFRGDIPARARPKGLVSVYYREIALFRPGLQQLSDAERSSKLQLKAV